MRLKGKNAIITAAAQGIGRATAIKFASEGCNVIAVDINYEKLKDLETYQGIQVRKLDVLDKEQIGQLAKDYQNVDILFNCVGYVHQGSIFDCNESDFDFSFAVNVKSMFLMCKAFLPQGLPNRFAYGTTKAAVIGLTKSLAVDLVHQGVRVNAVLPGTVETPSWRERVDSTADPEKTRLDMIARQKMKRLATAEEISHLITFLGSDESSYVTGSEYLIDGGVCL